jgi:hypothetical protein
MRPVFKTTLGLLVLLLSACEMKVKQAKTPPAPQPTVARAAPPATPPSNEPLSIPQTQVRLPEPQPIVADAVATPPTPPEPAAAQQKPRKPRPRQATASSKPEPAETADTPPADLPPRRMEPVLPEEQRRQRIEEISNRLHEVDQTLTRVIARGLSESQKHAVERIRNFATRAYQAKDQGDIKTASGLADRALLLAEELDRAR